MSKTPLITIITPVFNVVTSGRGEFLRQAIESVHSQTYENIEHIVQDGASTDGTLDILKEYEDKGWIKLYSEKDKNIYEAINRAVEKSSGKYWGFLGSDDYYKDNDIIEHIVNTYLQDETIDYVYGDEEHISFETGEYIKTWYGNAHENEFWRGVCYATGAMFFKTSVSKEIGLFDLNYPVVADLKFQMLLKFKDYKPVYCNRVINVFREGAGLSSNEDTLFYHRHDFAEICSNLWKNFDDTMTPEKAELMIKYDEYSEEFLIKLRRYVINLKLKNIDYISFNKHLEAMIYNYYSKMENKELSFQKGDKKEYLLMQELINQRNTSNNLLVACKDDLKDAICELKSELNILKNEVKNLNKTGKTQTRMSFYPFKNFTIFKIKEDNNCERFYLFGKIPILKLSKDNMEEN